MFFTLLMMYFALVVCTNICMHAYAYICISTYLHVLTNQNIDFVLWHVACARRPLHVNVNVHVHVHVQM